MNYITTTQLRTKSSELVASLKRGIGIFLIYRSVVIGEIQPLTQVTYKTFNIVNFKKLLKSLNLPKTTLFQRKEIYQRRILQKYGKNIS